MAEDVSSGNQFLEMVICDEALERNSLYASWISCNRLMAFAAADPKERDFSITHPSSLHDVRWNLEMHSTTGRKLANESRLVFVTIQRLAETANNHDISQPQLLKFSRNYRSILRSCFLELKQKYEESIEPEEDLEKQMGLFSVMELIWSLCEILFLETLPDGVVLLQLVEWCKWHFTTADELVQECTSNDGETPTCNHPKYWDAIFSLVLQGRVSEARNLLKLHPSYQTQTYDAFSSIDELLRKMPSFLYHQGQSLNEFEMKWRHWHDECGKRLHDGDFDTTPQIKAICKILYGDDEVIRELSDLNGSWFQLLISYLLYKNPTINAFDIHYHSKVCIEMCGGFSEFSPIDNILLAAFKFDIPQVIRECCSHLSTWWLPAHLADLLHYAGLLPPNPSESGTDLREHLLVEYASSLSSMHSLWQVVVDYLACCGPNADNFLPLFVQRIPIPSEKKAAKVLRMCRRKGLLTEAKSICLQMCRRALQYNRLGTALSWSIQANDSSYAMYIADKILTEYAKTGVFKNVDLVDYLGPSVLMSERLTFLSKYRDFHKLYTSGQLKEAAQLLYNLVVNAQAPVHFWPSLLIDCLPFLQSDELYYDVDQTAGLLNCLNKLEQKTFLAISEDEQESQKKKLKHLRLALTNNLAKAIVS